MKPASYMDRNMTCNLVTMGAAGWHFGTESLEAAVTRRDSEIARLRDEVSKQSWISFFADRGVPRVLMEDADSFTGLVVEAADYLAGGRRGECAYCGSALIGDGHANCSHCGAPRRNHGRI